MSRFVSWIRKKIIGRHSENGSSNNIDLTGDTLIRKTSQLQTGCHDVTHHHDYEDLNEVHAPSTPFKGKLLIFAKRSDVVP